MNTPTFGVREVAAATGVTANQINMWADRLAVLPGEEDHFPVAGRARKYSPTRAVQIALLSRLLASVSSTKRAGLIASGFTDCANMPGDPDSGGELRLPGALYRHGRTILVANEGHDIGRVVRMTANTSFETLFRISGGPRTEIACMVDVGPLLYRVYAALDVKYPPQPQATVRFDAHDCQRPASGGRLATARQ